MRLGAVALALIAPLLLTGCYVHEVDTFPKWCEQITGVDLEAKYRPFWAAIFGVRFDPEAIRDDFTKFLDYVHTKKTEGRAPRMAWRDGTGPKKR